MIGWSLLLLFVVVYMDFLHRLLGTADLTLWHWVVAIALGSACCGRARSRSSSAAAPPLAPLRLPLRPRRLPRRSWQAPRRGDTVRREEHFEGRQAERTLIGQCRCLAPTRAGVLQITGAERRN